MNCGEPERAMMTVGYMNDPPARNQGPALPHEALLAEFLLARAYSP